MYFPEKLPNVCTADKYKDVYCRIVFRVKNQKQLKSPSTGKWINYGIFIQWNSIPAIEINEPKIIIQFICI